MSDYETVIGIETHAQLCTASKMFCRCQVPASAVGGGDSQQPSPPNSLVCPVCLGMPGALPVANRQAVEQVLIAALALNCRIPERSWFDRKNYHYPDLPKGYQISQSQSPLGRNGWIDIQVDATIKRIAISDVHLEEDTGKLTHVGGSSLIDFNRSGVPLMEIVTAPDMSSVDEVREYALELRRLLRYLGLCSGNMEQGAMRFEANVSIRPQGSSTLGARVEIKNLNSFRALLRSVEYEIERQQRALQQGLPIDRETRGWDEEKGVTYVQRSKETAEDYRYFPEPDLPVLEIDTVWVERLRQQMAELPQQRRTRFASQYGLSPYEIALLTEDRDTAEYFEAAANAGRELDISPKVAANWITGDLFGLLNAAHRDIGDVRIPPRQLVELLALLAENAINIPTAKHVLRVMFETGQAPKEIVVAEGLGQIADRDRLASLADSVLDAHPDIVAQYKGGKQTVLRFLVGQVMKATQGRADPQLASQLLEEKLRSA